MLRWLLRGTAVVCAALLVVLGVLWLLGTLWIRRAEPDALRLPDGVPGRLLTVAGQPVHVVERGEGPALVLVHGFAGSTYDWEEHLLEPLAAHHRVIAIDLLGMGFSARDEALPYALDLWAEQVLGTLDALGIERATVAAHSLGGAVAATLAAAHPERVERLVLIAPLVPMSEGERNLFFRLLAVPGVGEAVLGWHDHLPALPGFSPDHQARARTAFRIRGTRQALLRWVRHGWDPARLDDTYRRVTVPTLVIHGRTDDTVPWNALARTAPHVEDVLVLPLDGVGHWILRDAPDRVLAALAEFEAGGDSLPHAPARR